MARAAKRRNNRGQSASGSKAGNRGMMEDMFSLADTVFRGRRERGAEQIMSFAEAARDFSSTMTPVPQMEQYMNAAADTMEQLADYVSETEFEQMFDDATQFARRHPVATMAVAVAAGLVAAQMMRSDSNNPRGYNQTTYGSSSGSRRGGRSSSKPRAATRGRSNGNGAETEDARQDV